MPVALVEVEQVRDLALEVAEVAEAGEGVGVGLRLELARAAAHELLGHGGLDGAGGVHEVLHGVGELLGVALRELLAQRAHEHRLERRHVAGHLATRRRRARP